MRSLSCGLIRPLRALSTYAFQGESAMTVSMAARIGSSVTRPKRHDLLPRHRAIVYALRLPLALLSGDA